MVIGPVPEPIQAAIRKFLPPDLLNITAKFYAIHEPLKMYRSKTTPLPHLYSDVSCVFSHKTLP